MTFGCYALSNHGIFRRDKATNSRHAAPHPASVIVSVGAGLGAGACANAPASASMEVPRAEETSHRTVQQNRSVGNSGGSASLMIQADD